MRNPFRRRVKKNDSTGGSDGFAVPADLMPRPPLFAPTHRSAQLLAFLPPAVIERVFAFVCPHTRDESYDSCEGSAASIDSLCMLCDLRDLSHSARVCRAWRAIAIRAL